MLVTYLPETSASSADHKGIFVAFSKYEERDLPKSAGWRWDPSTRRWFTSDPERARRLVAYADEAARAALSLRSAEAEAAIEASRASLATIDVPAPEGLSYLPYQRAGIAYALVKFGDIAPASPLSGGKGGYSPSRGGVLIADEMG
jgi:SWI/SNF-related matrix-associated actin-dependent regulator 1 of chromatin subfamily A